MKFLVQFEREIVVPSVRAHFDPACRAPVREAELCIVERAPFVLSGGGARGVAHIGVLRACAEAGIVPSAISSTSAGALVGAFIA
ncbi:MAG: patatin-like phospholipase family protein, partial [Flavobacteriales bacterium]